MKQTVLIFKRELKGYFVSPIAYIVISIFLLVTGWFFFTPFFLFNQADMRNFFSLLPITLAFVIPAVTMRLFSEEFNVGSHETLMTLPITYTQVIMGKYLASVCFVAIMLLSTITYPLTISFLGQLDWGPVFGGYLGAILLGASFCAIGIFASSITKNQIIAFITGMAICFILTMLDKMLFFLPPAILGPIEYMGTDAHFGNISKGIIDSRDLIYFLSVSFIGLYATNLAATEKC